MHMYIHMILLSHCPPEHVYIWKIFIDLTVGDTAPSVTGGNLTVSTTTPSASLFSCPTDAQKQQVEVGNDNLVEMLDETDVDLLASSGDDGLGLLLPVGARNQSPKRDWATLVEDEEKALLDSLEEGSGKSPSPVGKPPATASPAKTPEALPSGMS